MKLPSGPGAPAPDAGIDVDPRPEADPPHAGDPVPDHRGQPRVQDGAFGASERFAISPGHEDQAYLTLPGGQSGHPLSPYYRAGFLGWAHGEALPLLPGPAQHSLTLTPH